MRRGSSMDRATPFSSSSIATLTQGSLLRHVFRLAWPAVMGLFGIFMFNLADVYFVGKLGTVPLAAISFVFPLLFAFITLSIALGVSATSLVSHTLGSGRGVDALELGSSAIILSLLYGFFLSVVGSLTIELVFGAMGADAETLPEIVSYMRIWYMSAPLLTLLIVSNHLLRAHGVSIFPGLVMLFASLLNIVLDPLLIFGLWGFPRLEIAGAAWATLIARVGGCLLLLYGLWLHGLLWKVRSSFRALWGDFCHLFRFMLPAAGQQIVQPLTEVYMVILLSSFGTAAVATYGVITRLYSIIFLPYYALSIALVPIVAQNWGGAHRSRVREAGLLGVRSSIIWGVLSMVPLYLFSSMIAESFGDSEDFISWTSFYFRYVPWSFAGAGIVMLLGSFFYGIARPRYAFFTEVVHWVVLYAPVAYIASRIFGVEGILLSETFASIAAAVLALFVYRFVSRRGF